MAPIRAQSWKDFVMLSADFSPAQTYDGAATPASCFRNLHDLIIDVERPGNGHQGLRRREPLVPLPIDLR